MQDRNPNFQPQRRLFLLGGLAACSNLAVGRAIAADHHHHHDHHAQSVPSGVKRHQSTYNVPTLNLVREDGSIANFPKELDDGRAVILQFFYTSCTTICPVSSQLFANVQDKLGRDLAKVHLVSISIDPEYDTPKRIAAHARKFQARAQWQHYTGSAETSVAIQRAFDAYVGDKMNHMPITFLRAPAGKNWVRLEGFANADQIVEEYRNLVRS
jgi:protein SCO1/2